MINAKRRLDKIESSLTPKQAVLLWIEEAHRHTSMREYVMSLKDGPETAFPMYMLPDQVEKAVVTRMKGRPKDEVIREIREAVRDTLFLFHLHQAVNGTLMNEHNTDVYRLRWLEAELRLLLHQYRESKSQDSKGKRSSKGRQSRRPLWKESAEEFLRELYSTCEAVRSISHRYFDGSELLFAEVREGVDKLFGIMLSLAETFNYELVCEGRGARKRKDALDLEGLEEQATVISEAQANYLVSMAKVETLTSMGESRVAVALVERMQ